MATDASDLGLKLVNLVAPNWPTIEGTDISVLDLKACVTRATAEQRQTAREVRDTVERIWELDQGAPVRKLLEGLCRPAEGTTGYGMAGSEGVMPPQSWQGCQLPNELLLRVLHFLLPDDDWPKDIEVVSLGRLRGASKSTKELAETLFPNTLHRYISRIVRKLLHGQASPVHVSGLAFASAPLFKRCKELRIWMAGDEVAKLNNILEVFGGMEELVVYVTSEEAIFSGVDLTVCRSLRTVRIHCIDRGAEPEEANDADLSDLDDTYVDRNIDISALTIYKYRATTLRPGCVRLELANNPFDSQELFRSLRNMDPPEEIRFWCHATTEGFEALGLSNRHGPPSLIFECGIDEDDLAILALGDKVDLKVLLMGWTYNPIDPAVLALRTNKSLIHLRSGSLLSADLDLDLNNHLRQLDLAESLTSLEGGIVTGLRQLGTQLAANTTLEILNLGRNEITDEAALALQLSKSKGLKKLSLRFNKLSDTGLRAALQGNTTLELVDVSGNEKVTMACARELSGGERRVITRRGNQIWEEAVKEEV